MDNRMKNEYKKKKIEMRIKGRILKEEKWK
jgi:hypothetical protein